VHKGMGGRKGSARTTSEGAANKIRLCHTCHMASHFEHHIDLDGFHCGLCRRLKECRYGLVTLGFNPGSLPDPW
jgi:hypothetical protein